MNEPLPTVEPELLIAAVRLGGPVLFRNEAWTRVLGDDEQLWNSLVEEDRKIAERNLQEAAAGSMVTNAVFMAERIDRDLPLPLLLHFIPVPGAESGNVNANRVVMITGEVLAEPFSWTENQTDKHRMETLGRMTMGIAHDFNNLLSGILGHVELATAGNRVDPVVEDHLKTIEQAANDGAALVNKIQRYIRQEKEASFEAVDLAGLIQDCVVLTKPYWYNEPRRQGIAIDLQLSPIDVPPVEGSAAELRDVFVNLLLNAVQALPDGGTISIDAELADGRIAVRVSDTGTGMTDTVRRRIFEPLFTTKGGRGSGMGLAVAFGIIQEHEGSIDVESEPGSGSTFTLTFPVSGIRTTATAPEEAQGPVQPASVLVVDDETMVRSVIDRLLTLKGHRVRAVESAAAAMQAIEEDSFDVVITDQGMPETSGRELAHRIHTLYPEMPVILLTGDTELTVDPDEIRRVVAKPFKAADLESAIRAVL